MTDYEPGTLAVATVRGVPNVRITRTASSRPLWYSPEAHGDFPDGVGSIRWHSEPEHVTDVRPLVVLDLADNPLGGGRGARTALLRALRGEYTATGDWLADQIEAQTKPPKPDEPTGLGAVVEDAEGADWHRARDGRWIAQDGLRSRAAAGWGHINVVRVLSEGVQA